MRHPLDPTKDKLDSSDVVGAIRLAIVAEFDAISFYLQVSRRVEDEAVRRGFRGRCQGGEGACGRVPRSTEAA